MFGFKVIDKDPSGHARLGVMNTFHGEIPTPVFMAVGTQGTVKGMTPAQLREASVSMVLGNTYHLMLRPGADRIARLGGLHRFTGWNGPMLTDSGGFQVFSLAGLSKKTEAGVAFKSHVDGSNQWLDPERSMEVQELLGADIAMAFDDCTPYPATYEETRQSMELTHRWAKRSLEAFKGNQQVLFGIVQGGMYEDLRRESVTTLTGMPFSGYAIGGLSVGEPKAEMLKVLKATTPLLPHDKPRYLMGVGTPADLVYSVDMGVDMFDCVLPTRNARNGQAFTNKGALSIKNAVHRDDETGLDPDCACYTCTQFSRAYLHHLYKAKEILASVLLTYHNLAFYQNLMARMREAIDQGRFQAFKQTVYAAYGTADFHSLTEAI